MEKWTRNGGWYFPTSSGFPGGCTMTGGGDDIESMDLDLLGEPNIFFLDSGDVMSPWRMWYEKKLNE